MRIGDEVYVHGYVDEIRKDCIIIRNKGGYFGTSRDEIVSVEIKALHKEYQEPYCEIADTPQAEGDIEADKVVEALKICDHNSDGEPCKTCPYRDAKWGGAWESEDGEWCCYKQLAADAISLIERTERSE